ncbi:MAG: hypothetical protein JXA97_10485 [Anaerolineales bacterium]|nr:hypothetical protein [Anaerolineales bacterium]
MIADQDVKILQVIYVTLGLAVTMFAGIVLWITIQSAQKNLVPSNEQIQIVRALSFVVVLFSGTVYPAASFMFNKVLRGNGGHAPLSSCIRSAYVIRIGLFEGVALMSLIVSLLAGHYRVFQDKPVYLCVTIPYFILLGLVSTTFPSKERLQSHGQRNPLA